MDVERLSPKIVKEFSCQKQFQQMYNTNLIKFKKRPNDVYTIERKDEAEEFSGKGKRKLRLIILNLLGNILFYNSHAFNTKIDLIQII